MLVIVCALYREPTQILVSTTFINKNATVYSVAALAVCIVCGMFYDPPAMQNVQNRDENNAKKAN